MENKEKMKPIKFELNKKDFELLESNRKERGLDRTNYLRELIRGGKTNMFYSVTMKRGLENVSNACCLLREEQLSPKGEIALQQLEKGVMQLWRFSR